MESIITVETGAPSESDLRRVAVNRIIERAKGFANDPDLTKEQIYNSAKWTISKFTTSADEYQRAVRALAEALQI